MKITKKLASKVKIYNRYEYAKDNPFIGYRTQDPAGWRSSGWLLIYPNHKFKDAHWQNDGGLSFTNRGRDDKQEKLLEAQAKFIEIFGTTEFSKTPFGSWMYKKFVEKRNKEIEEMLKKQDQLDK